MINASLDEEHDQIIYKEYVNIGIAVDTERGLVVPSLRGADEMSIPDIARALSQLSDNVRDGSFSTADLQGSTFTITNPGTFGAVFGLPIINQPNVAIMGVGGIAKAPVVVTDSQGNDSIAIRSLVHLTLGYDHRVIDGAVADQFMSLVKKTLENWSEDVG